MSRFLTILGGIGLGFLFAAVTTPVYIFSLEVALEVGAVFYVVFFLVSSFLLIGLRDVVKRQNSLILVNLSIPKAAGVAVILVFFSLLVSYILPGMLLFWLHPAPAINMESVGLVYIFAAWWYGVFLSLSWWYLGLERMVSVILGICLLLVPIVIYLVPLLLYSVR